MRSWHDAEANCSARGGSLLSVKSRAERDHVHAALQSTCRGTTPREVGKPSPEVAFWMGGSRDGVDSPWHWPDGSAVGFEWWAWFQPCCWGARYIRNNVNDCMALELKAIGLPIVDTNSACPGHGWVGSYACSVPLYSICESPSFPPFAPSPPATPPSPPYVPLPSLEWTYDVTCCDYCCACNWYCSPFLLSMLVSVAVVLLLPTLFSCCCVRACRLRQLARSHVRHVGQLRGIGASVAPPSVQEEASPSPSLPTTPRLPLPTASLPPLPTTSRPLHPPVPEVSSRIIALSLSAWPRAPLGPLPTVLARLGAVLLTVAVFPQLCYVLRNAFQLFPRVYPRSYILSHHFLILSPVGASLMLLGLRPSRYDWATVLLGTCLIMTVSFAFGIIFLLGAIAEPHGLHNDIVPACCSFSVASPRSEPRSHN